MFKLVVVTCPAATEGATLATTKGWTDVKACVHATTRTRRRRRRVTTEDFISLAVAGFKGKDSRVDFQAGKLIVTQKIEIVVNDAAMVDSRSTVSETMMSVIRLSEDLIFSFRFPTVFISGME
jgi:hypothetical protein